MFVPMFMGTVLYERPSSSRAIEALMPFGVGQLYRVMSDMVAVVEENGARNVEER